MRKVDLGGGVFGFETEGSEDRVGLWEPSELANRGWSSKAVDIYKRYRNGSDFANRITRETYVGFGLPSESEPVGHVSQRLTEREE